MLTAPGSLAADDQAPLLHEQFVAISQHRINHRKLKLIDVALPRLDQGDFGVCEECGEGIPLKRLKIITWAAYCVACQEQLDQEKFLGEHELSLTAQAAQNRTESPVRDKFTDALYYGEEKRNAASLEGSRSYRPLRRSRVAS